MILKSDGASLYNTTDLATIMERMREYHPDQMIYLTDKRQDLYFEQVFRCARKTKLVDEDTELVHIGFGTVNGADGHAFKTRDGGVMRLEMLINEINEKMYQKIVESREVDEEEARNTAKIIALSAIKYGDLSNQASKDYILILISSPPLKEIPVRTFFIPSSGSNPFLRKQRNRERILQI